jgi:hypothetical protein
VCNFQNTPGKKGKSKMRDSFKIVKFYTIKLPLILIAISAGLIFEFLVTFPFFIFCTIDGIGKAKKNNAILPD